MLQTFFAWPWWNEVGVVAILILFFVVLLIANRRKESKYHPRGRTHPSDDSNDTPVDPTT